MGNKLYVANLAFHLTETEIQDIFSPIGPVQEVKLILDKLTGKSRGFAFVTMASDGEAERAIAEMNGQRIEGRALAITEARPREDRPQGLGGARPQGHGGPFRPNTPPSAGGGGSNPSFGQNRPPFSGGSRPGGRDSGRGEPPRREKEKPRGPRPMRGGDDDDF